jgi:riboflavin kinase/FMN adenylyltransferase
VIRVVDDIDHLAVGLRFVATVGVFDGVHPGHVHVLERLRGLAMELGAVSVAITFEPHPQAVITGRLPELICDPDEKLERMAAAGAQVIVVQRFDEAFRSQTAEQFLDRLARGRELAGLVMSHESAFGRDRQGTVETVQRLAARDGWRLVEVDTLEVDGAPVSSSRIRAAVAAGDLRAAERLLGRPYAVVGRAGSSDATGGRALDMAAPFVLPPAGRYPVSVSCSPGTHRGAAAIDAQGTLRLYLGDVAPDVPLRVAFGSEDPPRP